MKKVKGFEQGETHREYLTFNELQALSNTECKYPVLKRAFIFSCLTGLEKTEAFDHSKTEIFDHLIICNLKHLNTCYY